jgi:hypothetical protein
MEMFSINNVSISLQEETKKLNHLPWIHWNTHFSSLSYVQQEQAA